MLTFKIFSMKYIPSRSMLILPILLSLLLSACMPKMAIMEMQPEYYPQCYQPFADLEKSRDDLIKRTLLSAAIGAAGGAAVGALISGNLKGALIGGGVGLIAGGVTGYATGKINQISNDRERMRSYQADMNADMRNAGRVEQYAMASLQCYTREFNDLLKQYKAGMLSKTEVELRYKEIRTGMNYISEILVDSKNELVKRDSEYRTAFEEEAKLKNKTAPAVASLEKKREKSRTRVKPAEIKGDGSKELQKLDTELGKRTKQAERKVQKLEQQEAKQAAAAEKNKGTHSINDVAKYYDKQYLDTVVSLEETEQLNQRTLAAMSLAAQNAGIDKV